VVLKKNSFTDTIPGPEYLIYRRIIE